MKILSVTGIIIGAVIITIGLAGLGTALNLVTIPWLTFNSKIQTNRDIVTKTYSADNALYNYHWFQEQSGVINTAKQNIDISTEALNSFELNAGVRSSWSFEDKTEDSRLRQVIAGNKSYYNSLVNDYNARAKEVDRAIFQDGLPLFFNLAQ